jgi:hypothetical protein
MRKIILMLLLAVVSSSAMAEWVNLGNDGDITAYVEPTTIRKDGNTAEMWYLVDYKTTKKIDGKLYMTLKSQSQFDCKKEQYRILSISYYSGNLGGGEVVSSSNKISTWEPVPPKSISEALWNYACGKKQVQ